MTNVISVMYALRFKDDQDKFLAFDSMDNYACHRVGLELARKWFARSIATHYAELLGNCYDVVEVNLLLQEDIGS